MKKFMMLFMMSSLPALADDSIKKKDFEINRENCNLPMKEIRQLLPNKDDPKKALKQCMDKATKERWKHPNKPTQK